MSTAVQPASTRDVQKGAVYAAEQLVRRLIDRSAQFPTLQVAGSTIALPAEKKFGSIQAVQTYVDAVLALNWVRAAWPTAGPVRVRERAGDALAHYNAGVIAVPTLRIGSTWALREMVVLHELAHHLGPAAEEAHGPEFAGRFVELVGEIISPEAGLLLRVTMYEQGVRVG